MRVKERMRAPSSLNAWWTDGVMMDNAVKVHLLIENDSKWFNLQEVTSMMPNQSKSDSCWTEPRTRIESIFTISRKSHYRVLCMFRKQTTTNYSLQPYLRYQRLEYWSKWALDKKSSFWNFSVSISVNDTTVHCLLMMRDERATHDYAFLACLSEFTCDTRTFWCACCSYLDTMRFHFSYFG